MVEDFTVSWPSQSFLTNENSKSKTFPTVWNGLQQNPENWGRSQAQSLKIIKHSYF